MSLKFEERTIPALDGVQLYLRDWAAEPGAEDKTPLLCLPGLTRNSADFEGLTEGLRTAGDGRRVLAMDFRGRGRSGYAEDYSTYNPLQEAGDVIVAISHLVGGPVCLTGTSRGGIVSMIVAMARTDLVKSIALNDIGPVIEPAGSARIIEYLGIPPADDLDWDGAAALLRTGLEGEFKGVSDEYWLMHARRTFRDENGAPKMNYDLKLRDATLDQLAEAPADLWPQFDALPKIPLLVIRGENSDILTTETVAAMVGRRPDLEVAQIADRGHAPFLDEPPAVAAVAALLARADAMPDPQPVAPQPVA